MTAKVISVFAGLGKSTVGTKYKNVCDLQSSVYRYINIQNLDYEKVKCNSSCIPNPDWPKNYLLAIQKAMKEYDVVLVPSNLDVRNLLVKNNIDFLFVLPSHNSFTREKLIREYEQRGNSEEFIAEVMDYFDSWSRNQEDYEYPIEILKPDEYLEDLLLRLKILHK